MIEIIKGNAALTISILSLIISLSVYRVYLKMYKISKYLYYNSQNEYMNSNTQIRFLDSIEKEGKTYVRLVVYNLDTKPLFLHSLCVNHEIKRKGLLGLLFPKVEMERIENTLWWPDPTDFESDTFDQEMYFHEKYRSLLVGDMEIVQIVIPEAITTKKYVFELITNRGNTKEYTFIHYTDMRFPYMYNEKGIMGRKYSNQAFT